LSAKNNSFRLTEQTSGNFLLTHLQLLEQVN